MSALPEFLVFAIVGAAAQLVDGALGMAYGVTSAGLLLGLGMPPVMASASVHYAETFTCGASRLSHLAAGNAECDPATGVQCTSGRDDKTIATLKDPTARESERIDFIFVKPPTGCRPVFDPAADADGDGVGTGLFAAAPAIDGPGGLVWPSDHTAVSMDVSCATTST